MAAGAVVPFINYAVKLVFKFYAYLPAYFHLKQL